MNDENQATIYENPLFIMLRDNLPSQYINANGWPSPTKLSEAMGIKRYTLYRWFQNKSIPSKKNITRLVELSNSSNCDKKGQITTQKVMLALSNF